MSKVKHLFSESLNIESQSNKEINIRNDQYTHLRFIGDESPVQQKEALRIHAEGYRTMGFVNDEAIDANGFLDLALDKTRTIPGCEYYIAINPEKDDDRATLRIVRSVEDGKYTTLPAYEATKGKLFPSGKKLLENLSSNGHTIKEISALAKTEKASPLSIFELLREIIQDACNSNDVWFFSIVSRTFDSLVKNMGKSSFIIIGEDVHIDDSRVNPNIMLKPAIFVPKLFYSNLMKDIETMPNNYSKKRLNQNLNFYAQGLQNPQLITQISAFSELNSMELLLTKEEDI